LTIIFKSTYAEVRIVESDSINKHITGN